MKSQESVHLTYTSDCTSKSETDFHFQGDSATAK